MGISKITEWQILSKQLTMYLYKIRVLFNLNQADKIKSNGFALQTIAEVLVNPQRLHDVFSTNEAHRELNGSVNVQSCRTLSMSNAQMTIPTRILRLKSNFLRRSTLCFIIGPCFRTDWKWTSKCSYIKWPALYEYDSWCNSAVARRRYWEHYIYAGLCACALIQFGKTVLVTVLSVDSFL